MSAPFQEFTEALVGAGDTLVALWRQTNTSGEFVLRASTFDTSWSVPQTLASQSFAGAAAFAGNSAGTVGAVWIEQAGPIDFRLVGLRRGRGAPWPAPTIVQGAPQLGNQFQFSPALAIDSAGTLMAVWVQGAAGAPGRIFASSLPAGSTVWTTPVQIDNPFGVSARPKIVSNGLGRFVAAWEQTINGRISIYGSVFGASGWQPNPQILEVDDRGDAFSIDMAAGPQGSVLVVWTQSDSVDYTVWAHRYAGTTWTEGRPIAPFKAGTARNWPQVAIDGAGNALVVTETSAPPLAPPSVEYIYLPSGTTTWTAPTTISSRPKYLGPGLALSMNATGAAVVVWQDDTGTAPAAVARLLR